MAHDHCCLDRIECPCTFRPFAAAPLLDARGGWGYLAAIPTDGNGKRLFTPGPGATFVVAAGLALFACTNLAFAGLMGIGLPAGAIRLAMTMISLIFLARAIGNFRYVGFFKSFRTSKFGRMDTRLYSPLCLALAHALCLLLA